MNNFIKAEGVRRNTEMCRGAIEESPLLEEE